jgi:hypothetical protein
VTVTTTGTGGGPQYGFECFPFVGTPPGCPPLEQAPLAYGECEWDGPHFIAKWLSGPYMKKDGKLPCCYEVILSTDECFIEGRPLVVENEALVAALSEGDASWCGARSEAPRDLPDAVRASLSGAWARRGQFEHASVASFARVTLELLGAGAPPGLVDACQRAALDEIAHARLCFALAARYGGGAVSPGPLPLGEKLPLRASLADIAEAAALEGCIGETVAAAIAHEELLRATDGEARRALATIFADESRHAELAWRTVAWALRAGGEPVRERLAALFARALSTTAPAHASEAADPLLAAHGVLDRATVAELQARTLRDVVAPCAAALLAAASARAASHPVAG